MDLLAWKELITRWIELVGVAVIRSCPLLGACRNRLMMRVAA
jgi:hypothetical protein